MNVEHPLPSPGDALRALLERLSPVATERVGLREAAGRVLAENAAADRPSPPLTVSAMDGYAVHLARLRPGRISVAGEAAIGRAPETLREVCAARIVTGAPVPHGATAVLRREDVVEGDGWIEVGADLIARLNEDENIRRQGENGPAGTVFAKAGRLITPPVAGALAAFGVASPTVRCRVRVAIVATGDEILPPEHRVEPWQLRDSNSSALTAFVACVPWLMLVSTERSADEQALLRASLGRALEAADAVLVSGGVSMGQRDFVPGVLESLGVKRVFHCVSQRPGKPLLAGVGSRGQAVLALPGNPVSVMVTARRFGAPALARLAGMDHVWGADGMVVLDGEPERAISLWLHRPVRLTTPGRAVRVKTKGSGDVIAVSASDGFVEIPPGESGPGPWPFYAWTPGGGMA
ncbi:MAG: molybdopterin molybdenumtransferase MoeA [Leptolyngbya sp. PLA2]|nr:molybdopterin molybdenumtransferase MoeA [Leptolyngbya sp.]MCE7970809.1 molybdopterin molybdenumtransferase MoeA [Leptolyngbya sp. PL-A2]MCQ3939964.1 molybdopterin molybdenumtransferase MoeA [cyanobacterium CYA1]MCZ7633591.1 molybdopterin molybdotransferase MoeA [Phycisphaerales bacterium]MDL1903291.1 molybdopterin molybdotransferase MoeA [Synechococcales cyanobacterium CNB]GIK17985.1 MAG: molybdopterin molybdenumtransferase MoeA [Planctomycetota bacterium]